MKLTGKKAFIIGFVLHALVLCVLIFTATMVFGKPSTKQELDALLIDVSIPENFKAKRVVSLGPAATEIMFAINAQDKLVGRTDLCNYPLESQSVPSVGGFNGQSISLEAIVDKKPDLVILYAGMHDYLVKSLLQSGIKVFTSDANSIEQVEKEILEIGKITDRKKEAEAAVESMRKKLSEVKAGLLENSALREKKVFWQVYDEPLMTVGNSSFINDIIENAGGKNIFDDIDQAYPVINMEEVIKRQPEFFVCVQNYSKQTDEEIKKRFGVEKIILINPQDEDIYVRPGPRCVEAVEKLADVLWNEKD